MYIYFSLGDTRGAVTRHVDTSGVGPSVPSRCKPLVFGFTDILVIQGMSVVFPPLDKRNGMVEGRDKMQVHLREPGGHLKQRLTGHSN